MQMTKYFNVLFHNMKMQSSFIHINVINRYHFAVNECVKTQGTFIQC